MDVDARDKGIIVHEVLRTFWEQHFTGPLPSVEEGQLLVEELLNGAYQERGSQPPADLIRSMRSFIRRDLQRVQGAFGRLMWSGSLVMWPFPARTAQCS